MATTPVSSTATQDATQLQGGFGNLKLDDFMKMLLAELQNQDPLSPMDASQMLTQIGQITQIGTSQQLTSTLDSVLLGQNLNNATSLIGKTISGLDEAGKDIVGRVDKVTVANGKPLLSVGEKTVKLENVRAVLPEMEEGASKLSEEQIAAVLKQLQETQKAA